MDIEGQRRSERFEDRGRGGGGPGRGGLPIGLLADIVHRFGVRGTLLIAAVVGVGYFFMPWGCGRCSSAAAGLVRRAAQARAAPAACRR